MAYKRKKGKSIVGTKKRTYPFKGVQYKSGLERNMAMLLDEAKIPFEYESTKFDCLTGFSFPFKSYERQSNGKGEYKDRGGKKVLGVSYTPDFIGDGFIIETKGYANESFPMRWKLFKKLLTDGDYDPDKLTIYKPQKLDECKQTIELIKLQQNGK